MGQPGVHFEIGGEDRVGLQQFYAGIFGWDVQDMPQMNYGMVKTGGEGGIGGGISGTPADSPVRNGVTVYIQVDNLQAYLDRVDQQGGKTFVPPTSSPGGGSFAWFSDPQGNCVGLFQD